MWGKKKKDFKIIHKYYFEEQKNYTNRTYQNMQNL